MVWVVGLDYFFLHCSVHFLKWRGVSEVCLWYTGTCLRGLFCLVGLSVIWYLSYWGLSSRGYFFSNGVLYSCGILSSRGGFLLVGVSLLIGVAGSSLLAMMYPLFVLPVCLLAWFSLLLKVALVLDGCVGGGVLVACVHRVYVTLTLV